MRSLFHVTGAGGALAPLRGRLRPLALPARAIRGSHRASASRLSLRSHLRRTYTLPISVYIPHRAVAPWRGLATAPDNGGREKDSTEKSPSAVGATSGGSPPTDELENNGDLPPINPDKIDKRVWPIAASSLLMGTAIGVIIPVMPLLGAELGLSKAEYGSLISVMGFTRLCLNIPCAWAAEKYGRKPLLVGGPVISSIGMTLTATATSLQELMTYRFFTGAGGASQMTGAQLYLSDISTTYNRARTLAPLMAGFAAGAALGPVVGGLLADQFGLSAPFFFVGAAIGAVSLNNFLSLTETKPRRKPHAGEHKKSLAEDFRDTARQWRPLLSNPDMQAALASHMSFWAASAGVMFALMPLYATSLGLTATEIGTCFMITPIINVLGSQPAAWVSDKIGRKKALVPGILTCATAAALFPFATTQLQLMGALGVWATGSTLLGTTPTSYVSDISTSQNRAQALALLRSAGDAGLMLGGGLLGLVADCTSIGVAMGSASCLLLTAGIVAVPCFVGVAVRARSRRPLTPKAGAIFASRATESVSPVRAQEEARRIESVRKKMKRREEEDRDGE